MGEGHWMDRMTAVVKSASVHCNGHRGKGPTFIVLRASLTLLRLLVALPQHVQGSMLDALCCCCCAA